MRTTPLALLLLFTAGCDRGLTDLATSPPWSERFGDGSEQAAFFAAADVDGNTALAGTYEGTLDLGGGPLQGDFVPCTFVAELDARGHHRWSVPIIGGDLATRGLAPTADGWVFTAAYSDRTVVAGTVVDAFGNDVLLASFDGAGKPRWVKHWSADDGGPSGAGSADPTAGVAVDAHGDIVVAGVFKGTFGFGTSTIEAPDAPGTVFVTKLDPEGRELWATTYGGLGDTFSPTAIAVDPGGDIIVAGSRSAFNGTGGFVARFDEHGKLRNHHTFSGTGVSAVQSVAVDPRGDIVIAGQYQGEVHIGDATLTARGNRSFAAALSAEGTVRWASAIGEDDDMSITLAAHVVADAAGVLVSGTYSGSLQGFPDRPSFNRSSGFVVEISSAGEVGRFQVLSPIATDISTAPVLALSNDDLLMAGGFIGDLTRAGMTLHSAGGRDVFVSRAPR